MKVYVLLVCVWLLCCRTEAQSRAYLISAPLSFRLDALETVVVQLFGFTDEVTVYVFLKTSMAPNHKVLAREVVTLNAQNNHQADAKVRLYPNQLDKSVTDVVLHVQSDMINQHQSVPINRANGFLFIQTDKPLYTPLQSVKVRAFSLNQELRPANRSVFLTFKDPDRTTVDIVEMVDVNNGIPSLQNPFKIPINPKLGIWSIEASYSNDFTTTATTDFEVREYVLPSISILVEPEANYISHNFFTNFNFKVSAKYLHGAPVDDGEVFLRYGYVSGKNPPVIISNSVIRESLSPLGEVDVNINMENILSQHDGPKDLNSLVGKYLYIAVLVEESEGGIIQETEFAAVKFVKSPYSLSLVSTPPFIKPGLPYKIQVLVKDHLDKPVRNIQVRLVERQLFRQGRDSEDMSCTESSTSSSDGLAYFICNIPTDGVRAVLMFQTEDSTLPAASQSSLSLTSVAYYSPNQRYLYIDTPLTGPGLRVGQLASLSVYSATPSYIPIRAISYLVISKGKVVHFGSEKFLSTADNKQRLNFHVTSDMVPSIRLLVYYILFGEGTSELVADSVWLDVKDKCVNGLQTDLSLNKVQYKPKENLQLNVRASADGLVALSAVDSAIFTLRPNYQDPVSMVFRHIEQSDLGCGGGGGKDSADVFRLAGLTFITNANAAPSTSNQLCTAVVRAKRALTEEEKKQIAESYGRTGKQCCQYGMRRAPTYTSCLDEAETFVRKNKIFHNTPSFRDRCKQVFQECCEALLNSLGRESVIARSDMGPDFDLAPSLVRSYFPESWMWEVQRISSGQLLVSRPLPDSLTTWQIKAVGMFQNGMCVADPVQVSVNLPVSVDIPLPYQVVRGEQLELTGSVYNQQYDRIRYCVTLKVGPAICLLKSEPVAQEPGFHSTACTWSILPGREVASVAFKLLGLEPGEHTLTFTVKTRYRTADILEKKLRVVPEGVRREVSSGGRLDPQGVYGSEKRTVELKNQVPVNIVPSISILVEPEANYISHNFFTNFNFKVSAKYLHGAPVDDGEVFLRYGYVSGKNPPVIISNSVIRESLSSLGEVDVNINMENILSQHDGPKDLNSLVGKYLYIGVLVKELEGGITQETEFAAVKFVKSPYSLSLVSTPPFIKPGLPYKIQVLVKDHLDKPVRNIRVRLVERQLFRQGRDSEDMSCTESSTSSSNGLTLFICNTPTDGVRAVLMFQTEDSTLPAASQSSLSLTPVAYYSPNQRYLHIDTLLTGPDLRVGQLASLSVYSATPSYIPIRAISYLVISKGKVVHFGSEKFLSTADNTQRLIFHVTSDMVPSIRLLVYYILFGEGTSELVADSVWLDVKDKCVNGLQTDLSLNKVQYKPKENLQLNVRASADGLVALSAVDSAIFTLRPNYQDPVSMVFRHIEQSDLGCGGGGGKDSADVFRLAGLTFITNANAAPSTSNQLCTAVVRAKRALTEEEKKQIAESYGRAGKQCCQYGMRRAPTFTSCLDEAETFVRKNKIFRNTSSFRDRCKQVFQECCEALLNSLGRESVIARSDMGPDFDLAPSLVRSYFPESWMWEVQRISSGQLLVSRPLPDSLTTWQIKAVGMFQNGMCVADPVQVSVNLPVSVDIPLPYQVVRGEQLELTGSVYNQQYDRIRYCVTLKVGPAICLLKSEPVAQEPGFHSTACTWSILPGREVASVAFELLGLEPGEHTLTFTVKTRYRTADILEKKLRVVPEGVRREVSSGGRLDPQGVYGSEKRTVELKNQVPVNIVPNTNVERMLTINGEVLGEVLTLAHNPEGFRQLINLPSGSAEVELGGLLPLIQLYQYLESSGSWNVLGEDIQKSAANMKQKIREGLVSISSFRLGDSSYSMWRKRESSTWLTALVVRALSAADPVVSVNHQALSESVTWLIFRAQQPDGSFREESPYKSNKILADGTDAVEKSVYLTSFVLIALHQATKIRDPILQLQIHDNSINSAVAYISQHALNVKSVYVRAVATYAVTLHDPNSVISFELISSLEKLARQKGDPVVLRYWQEATVTSDWLKPDQSSGVTVETTAYVLLTMLRKERLTYVKPILSWLTQDQHYGEGFYSVQDIFLTLEALTEYSKVVSRAAVSQDIRISYGTKGILGQVHINQSRPVASPLQITKNDDITVSTGYGRGVSNVKMKTVYYQTVASTQPKCNFELTVEVVMPSTNPRLQNPTLAICVKYKPPPNEVYTESSLTVMKIQLPTGVAAYLEDLKQFTDPMQPIISHYELQGNTVVIQMDSVPSDIFLCIDFRLRTTFKVTGATKSLVSVTEPQDKGSLCTKQFSYEQQELQRLCLGVECQCMTAACAIYRGDVDVTLTADKRTNETFQPHIKYAYKVSVTSSAAEGDFMIYTATVDEVIKSTSKDLEGVRAGTVVDLVKKATCSGMDIQSNKQYLVMGANGSEVTLQNSFKYRLPLDSEAVVELWPDDCSSPKC
ncbi:complement C5-like [Archocentrus centrarchus]|uniref:complement C5-like n=1 Tax=Archocentrus centrarchus TaxID=63155 RepID=UPI0011EA3763|nr:complement C5-like [Archocentrus centrarchus]